MPPTAAPGAPSAGSCRALACDPPEPDAASPLVRCVARLLLSLGTPPAAPSREAMDRVGLRRMGAMGRPPARKEVPGGEGRGWDPVVSVGRLLPVPWLAPLAVVASHARVLRAVEAVDNTSWLPPLLLLLL
jgi:hypothetical protein